MGTNLNEIWMEAQQFWYQKKFGRYPLLSGRYFVSASMWWITNALWRHLPTICCHLTVVFYNAMWYGLPYRNFVPPGNGVAISLTHWGRVTQICVSKLTIIGSDNGLSPGRRQVIIWTNDGILLIRTLGTNFSEILSEIHSFSFKKMHLKMSSAKWRLFCLGLNELSEGFPPVQSQANTWSNSELLSLGPSGTNGREI